MYGIQSGMQTLEKDTSKKAIFEFLEFVEGGVDELLEKYES